MKICVPFGKKIHFKLAGLLHLNLTLYFYSNSLEFVVDFCIHLLNYQAVFCRPPC
jgi:hypothetical protein